MSAFRCKPVPECRDIDYDDVANWPEMSDAIQWGPSRLHSMMKSRTCNSANIVVAGGGPAGAIAAILLRRAGASVILVDGNPRTPWFEGAGTRLVAALKAKHLTVEGLGPLLERKVKWGNLAETPNREHMLSRPVFDDGLKTQAADEGVQVVSATIRQVRPRRLMLQEGQEVAGGLVFDARGRRASASQGRLRGVPTVSIAGAVPGGEPGAQVTALADGWLWSIDDGTRAWMQVTVDAALAGDPGTVWRRCTDTEPPTHLRVTGAELRLNAPVLNPEIPGLGDAAVAMDPLSGHGLFWALASALMAPPIAKAILAGKPDLATRFYGDRVISTFHRQARVGRDFYRAAGLDGPFWEARRRWPDDEPAEPAAAVSPPHLEQRVVVRNGQLAETSVLVTAHEPEGVAFVDGIEIGPVLDRLGRGPLPGRAEFATRILSNAPQRTAFRIHEWLSARGISAKPGLQTEEVRP